MNVSTLANGHRDVFLTGMEMRDDRLWELYRYWQDKRGDRIAPTRQDIDPADFVPLLPNIFIFKVQWDPLDFRVSLLGTGLVRVLGKDFTGAMFDEMYQGESAEYLRPLYAQVATTCEPRYDEHDARWMNKDFITYRRLLLPIASDGKRVERLLGCAFFYSS